MTQTTIPTALQRAAELLERIQSNIKHDNGAKATLKRALTGEPRHQRAAYPFVLRYLSETESKYDLDPWLWVIGFLAYYDQPIQPDKKRSFGQSARGLVTDSGGAERRFRALLDTSIEDLRSPLTAMVRLMKSKGIAINYPKLLVDLRRWDHPDQYVQDQWARDFWNAPSSKNTAEAEELEEVTTT